MPKTANDKMADELKEIRRSLRSIDDHISDNKYIWLAISNLEGALRREAQIMKGLRPCYISKKAFKNGPKKALFHSWIELKSPNMTQTLALVEYEDGTMEQVKPTSIIFTDSQLMFDEFYWSGEEENNEVFEESETPGGDPEGSEGV